MQALHHRHHATLLTKKHEKKSAHTRFLPKKNFQNLSFYAGCLLTCFFFQTHVTYKRKKKKHKTIPPEKRNIKNRRIENEIMKRENKKEAGTQK